MSSRTESLRTCTGCKQKRFKKELVRIVTDPEGRIIADLKGKLPTRGAYVCPDRRCIEKLDKRQLIHALKRDSLSCNGGLELSTVVAAAFRERVRSLLGMAQKGGKVVSGTNLVEAEMRRSPDCHWLALIAEDASEAIVTKLSARITAGGVPQHRFITREDLGRVMGKSPRSVLLVKDAGLARAVEEAIHRYKAVYVREVS
jgi:hypothetical protein